MKLFSASRQGGRDDGGTPKRLRVLLRMPNWLGDCVMALPACRLLRRTLPDAEIVAACRDSVYSLMTGQPYVDAAIKAADKGPAKLLATLTGGCREVRGLTAAGGFDLGILFTNSLSTALWMWRAGVRHRVGYDLDARRLLLSHPVPCDGIIKKSHFVDYYLGLARHGLGFLASGVPVPAPADPNLRHPRPSLSLADKSAAEALVASRGVTGPYAVFAPASAYGAVKDWPGEYYRELACLIRDRHGLPVFISGGTKQRAVCGAIADGLESTFSVAGETALGAFLGLVAGSALFVGGDSGGAHVAAGFGVPTLVIFGVTNPTRTAPLGARVCLLGRGEEEDVKLDSAEAKARAEAALRSIGVDEAAGAVESLMHERG